MTHTFTDSTHRPVSPAADRRSSERRRVAVPARLTWKDQRGAARFASVVTRDVSELGVYVECQTPVSIPLFRLVQLQLERDPRAGEQLPAALRGGGRILSAVYRVAPANAPGHRQGLALRLMIEPQSSRALPVSAGRATA